ncbi:hypothetical protein, partial [Escherichia coli]|uniref:hypothetical protein n=1 Tax=Escherichia coli TaxID=562 RepID=UPI0022460296
SIICSPMTSLKTSIKTITYLSDIGCLEIQGASLLTAGLRFHSLKTQVKNLSRLWSSTDELCPVDYFILMLVVSSFGTEQVVRLGLTLCHSGVSAYI